jgi:hypothetical protein
MPTIWQRLTPRAPARAHLAAAAIFWTAVGSFLLARGLARAVGEASSWVLPALVVGAAVGTVKGALLLRPSALKAVARIQERGDGRCLGGFLSWKGWLFVASMMLLGKVLRMIGLPAMVSAGILVAIGTALLVGSITYWRCYLGFRR